MFVLDGDKLVCLLWNKTVPKEHNTRPHFDAKQKQQKVFKGSLRSQQNMFAKV